MADNTMDIGGLSSSQETEKMETDEATETTTTTTAAKKAKSLSQDILETKYDWSEKVTDHLRIAVIGEEGCGKTSLILAIKNEDYPHPNEKYVSKRHHLKINVDGKDSECMIAEIDDWEKNAERRENPHLSLDAALLCFNRLQALNQRRDWLDELVAKGLPVVLVKILKKTGEDDERGTTDERYLSCCPHTKQGVRCVFEAAVREARRKTK